MATIKIKRRKFQEIIFLKFFSILGIKYEICHKDRKEIKL